MNKNTGQMILFPYLQLGTGQATKTDEFSENFQGGAVFNPKSYVADFGPLYRAFFGRFREKNLQHRFPIMRGRVKGCLEFFRKFIRVGSLTRPLAIRY